MLLSDRRLGAVQAVTYEPPEEHEPDLARNLVPALARSLGASVIVFGSGKARNAPEGYPAQRTWDHLVAFARSLDPLAADNGITIAMEHLNRGEFATLAELGYDGRMSVEAASENLEADCALTLALLKNLERESRAMHE